MAAVLPEPLTTVPMRVLAIVLVFDAMFYWLWKLRGRGTWAPPAARSLSNRATSLKH